MTFMSQGVFLAEEVRRKMQSLLGWCIAATVIIVFLLALVVIGIYRHQQLQQYEALIATKLSAVLNALIRDTDTVGNSAVVWTGLTDSNGREIYLEPLLDRINRHSSRSIDLLDYRGRDYIISKNAASTPRLSQAAINKTIETLSVQTELQMQSNEDWLLLSLPVSAPFADGLLGMMLIHVNLAEELQSLKLPANLVIRYDLLGGQVQADHDGWFARAVDVPISFDQINIPLRLKVGQPIWGSLMQALTVALVLIGSGLLLYRMARNWTNRLVMPLRPD